MFVKEALDFSQKIEEDALKFLKDLVLINSWTFNKDGVNRVVECIADFLPDTVFNKRLIKQENFGNHLIVDSKKVKGSDKFVLLVGHTDTVFPPDFGFNCFEDQGEIIRGPGVIDMKGGLVVGIFSLLFLHEVGVLDDYPVRFIFNSDEEIGSPSSKKLLCESSNNALCALVFECGGLDNTVITSRRGKLSIEVRIKGDASRADKIKWAKKSAIIELAHKILAFEELNRFEDISCNVGMVYGGVAPNVVPPNGKMQIDLRYFKACNREKILYYVEGIVKKSFVEGVYSSFKLVSERPPMERTEKNLKLFLKLKRISEIVNIPVYEGTRCGVSDANYISQMDVPVLDGLGPVGDNEHSEQEYMLKRSLRERIVLTSLLLLSLLR